MVELFYFFVFRIRCPVRKLWIFPPAELCCSVVAARRLTDLPTRFLKVGIAVSLRVFYTTGFIFQNYEIKCNYRHFRPDLWLFADVILWCEGEICGCVSGWVVFGETGPFVADGLKNPGFSEAEDMVGESTASGMVQCPGATGLEKCMRAGVGDGFAGVITSGRQRCLRTWMSSEISSRR